MSDFNIDPQAVINDLLEQIKRLTADNAVLRSGIQQLLAERSEQGSDQTVAE